MSEVHDSWLEGIGVDVQGFLGRIGDATASAVATPGPAPETSPEPEPKSCDPQIYDDVGGTPATMRTKLVTDGAGDVRKEADSSAVNDETAFIADSVGYVEGGGAGPPSDSYERGYEDGLMGYESRPGPRTDDAVIDYEEGYAKGHYEFNQKSPSAGSQPADGQAASAPKAGSAPKHDVDRDTAYDAGFWTGFKGGVAICPDNVTLESQKAYDLGYAHGQRESRGNKGQPSEIRPLSDEESRRGKEAMEEDERREKALEQWLDLQKELKSENPFEPPIQPTMPPIVLGR